jgi:hypothetical protein
MARPPFIVEFHDDPKCKFKFAQTVEDDEWIAKVAAEGWIIFSHDRKFHSRLPEISAIKQYNAGCFYLPGANSTTWDKLGYFIRSYDRIADRAQATPKPFIYNVAGNGRTTQVLIP